jgi:uncharacterized DUF497 family protein
MSQQFEWDAAKAVRNLKKHGVSFEEAVSVFADPLALIYDDPDHSTSEKRAIIVGRSTQGALLVVGFTDRSDRVRIITARTATARERRHHEENDDTSKTQ